MRIVIEIPDEDMRIAMSQQLDAAVARISGDTIKAQVEEILRVKFQRVDQAVVDQAVNLAARQVLETSLSRGGYLTASNAVIGIVQTEAAKAVAKALGDISKRAAS